MLTDLHIPIKNEEDLEQLLDELDEDDSGTIEFEEFYSCKFLNDNMPKLSIV